MKAGMNADDMRQEMIAAQMTNEYDAEQAARACAAEDAAREYEFFATGGDQLTESGVTDAW